jgi:hypothetical protein
MIMATNPRTTKRITKKISIPSPTLQTFLKDLLFNDEAYLTFLENVQGSLSSHGLEFAPDVSEKLLIDFRFAVDRARRAVKKSGEKLRFEDVFKLPIIAIDEGNLQLKPGTIRAAKRVDVYYSDADSESNRGTHTHFSPDTESQTRSSTDHWSTTKWDSTSIFKNDYRKERFSRCPLLSAETMKQLTKAIDVSAK